MNIKLVFFLFTVLLATNVDADVISPESVVNLANCYKHFDYHRELEPMTNERVWQYGDAQFNHYFEPLYQIHMEIDECLWASAPELKKLKDGIFSAFGFDQWLSAEEKQARHNYDGIQLKMKIMSFGKMIELTLRDWRRQLMAIGLAIRNFYQIFASILIGHLLSVLKENEGAMAQISRENLEYMKARLDIEWESNHDKLIHSGYLLNYVKKAFFDEYNAKVEAIKKGLGNVQMELRGPASPKFDAIKHGGKEKEHHKIAFDLPKVKRVIWVVRHSDRLDGRLCKHCKEQNKKQGHIEHNGHKYGLDNSPLSDYGKEIADMLEPTFKHIHISKLYVSPYVRTLDTADRLLGDPNNHNLKMRLEFGFLEGLRSKGMDDPSKLTYLRPDQIREGKLIELRNKIDWDYKSIVSEQELPEEIHGFKEYPDLPKDVAFCDDALFPFAERAMRGILAEPKIHVQPKHTQPNYPWIAHGEEDAEHIVVVTHAPVIVAMQQLFDGKYGPIPPSSVTKLVELDRPQQEGTQHDDLTGADLRARFRMIYGSVTTHLGKITDPLFYQ